MTPFSTSAEVSPVRRKNSFDLLRLLAALLVVFSHCYLLTAADDPLETLNQQLTLGRLGLAIFFVLSGYLVWQSWQRDPAFWRYLARRLLRLWPALLPAAALTALIAGPILSQQSLSAYFSASQTWGYLWQTMLLLTIDQHLPGVLVGQPYPLNQPNIPLWTLPVEMSAYLLLVPLALALSGGKRAVNKLLPHSLAVKGRAKSIISRPLPALLLLAIVAAYGLSFSPGQFASLPGQIPWLLLLFLLGISANNLPAAQPPWLLAPGAVLGAGLLLTPLGPLGVALLALSAVFVAAERQPGPLANKLLQRYGDLSYGLYIFSFPLQLLLVNAAPELPAVVIFVLTLLLAVPLAALSWRYIERPALAHKPRGAGAS